MRWLIWVGFALVMSLWTVAVFIGTQVLGWAAGLLSSGQDAAAVQQAMQGFAWPAWLALWIDPVWLQQLGEAVAQSWAWLTTVLPVLATLAGWLVPLVWILWGVVGVGMLAVAIGLHWLSGRIDRGWGGKAAMLKGFHGR